MSVKSATPRFALDGAAQALTMLGLCLGFRDCDATVLGRLADSGSVRKLGRNETLTRGGTGFDYMSLVLRGSLEASVLRDDGHRHLVYFVQPGELSGLIGLVDEGPHLYDMRALHGDTIVFQIPGASVRGLAMQHPALSRALALQLAFRSRLLHQRLVADPSLALEVRVGKLLLTLAALHGLECEAGTMIDIRIAQSDMADWLGVSRQRVNFAIQRLRKDGLIEHHHAKFIIRDVRGLEAMTRV